MYFRGRNKLIYFIVRQKKKKRLSWNLKESLHCEKEFIIFYLHMLKDVLYRGSHEGFVLKRRPRAAAVFMAVCL